MEKVLSSSQEIIRPGRVSLWIYALAFFLIVLATASLMFISYLASRQADRQALEYEKSLFDHAHEEFDLRTAQSIAALAYSDEAVKRIVHGFDKEFIRNGFLNYFWEKFEIERTYIVSPDDHVIARAFRDYISFGSPILKHNPSLLTIAESSRKKFRELKVPVGDGFGIAGVSHNEIVELAEHAVEVIDGQPAHFIAMPIVPDRGTIALADEPPHVVVAIRYFDRQFVDNLANKLSLENLKFQHGQPEGKNPSTWTVRDHDNRPEGYFTWTSQQPGQGIWEFVVPIIVLLIIAISVAAFVAVKKAVRLVTILENSERLNHFNARHDPLTGIANRFQFTERMDMAIAALPKTGFALIICDLDHFKKINDTHGHVAGDAVICTVAERLKDSTGGIGLVARSGGDEFVILIDATTDQKRLASLCRKLIENVSQPIAIPQNRQVRVGISLGIAVAPDCGITETRLLSAADKALYEAKHSGRGAFSIAHGLAEIPSATTSGGSAAA
jgi:diguanylate cyclase (GGDEF)-like protein